jgi:aminomethyltransferase
MVEFAGYELPVLYKKDNGGVLAEHHQTRERAGLFDVSHMGQIKWHGKDAADFIETLVVGDIKGLEDGFGRLSLVTTPEGGIIDDTVITKAKEGYIYMVVNGATKHGDMAHFNEQLKLYMAKNPSADVCMDYMEESLGLVAIQGPSAMKATQTLLDSSIDLTKYDFMTGFDTSLAGVAGCRVTRCGYTGEDGFELSIPAEQTEAVVRKLMEHPDVDVAGLGARDSLRLEAGLCLYGNDLDTTITPTMAALGWTMGGPGSRRRTEQGFLGADKFLTAEGKFKKIPKKRVGFFGMKAPARGHTVIYDETGEKKIGEITSGTMSPCLKKPVAMGYVESAFAKVGTAVKLEVRGKMQDAVVSKMPFVDTHYYRVPE